MRILYIATIGGFMPFFKNLIRQLIDDGHVVDFAANQSSTKVPEYYLEWGCHVYDISCARSPFSVGNIKAIREIQKIAGDYDVVHCHTPIAAAATRIACRKLRKNGLKVVYTAHGFHFYKGAPLKNWIIYYPVEKICARWTDALITINHEDYALAQKKLKAKRIEYVPGVGIDVDKFANTTVDRSEKRKELGIPEDAFLLLSVGELNENKNHQIVIKALGAINDPKIHYVIAGVGNMEGALKECAHNEKVNLHLVGYRNDLPQMYKCVDLFVHPSFREGLPVALMEAMASGLPCIAANIRGCADLLNAGLFDPADVDSVVRAIQEKHTFVPLANSFSTASVIRKIKNIYKIGVDNEKKL